MTTTNHHPVDSATRHCCGGIGTHTRDCAPGKRPTCPTWCVADHQSDPACWGDDDSRMVALTVEDDLPVEDDPLGPRVTPYKYRLTPAHREVVKLHLYRPSDIDHLNLDDELHLTADEARALAGHLLAVADEIDGATHTITPAGVVIEILRRLAESRIDTAELAHHLQLSEATLIGRLTGKSVFTVAELVRVGELLDCTLLDLIPEPDSLELVKR